MKELNFTKEYQKIANFKNDIYKKLISEISADTIEMCERIVRKNERFLYGDEESFVTQNKCYNVVYNTLAIIVNSTDDDTIRRLFVYASLCDTLRLLDEDNVLAFEDESPELGTVFLFSDGESMHLCIYEYRLKQYSRVDDGNKLKSRMQEKNFTAATLSAKSGVSKRTIENYMSGHRSLINAKSENVIKLAVALEVEAFELM